MWRTAAWSSSSGAWDSERPTSARQCELAGRAVQLFRAGDRDHRAIKRHIVLLELTEYVLAEVRQEADPIGHPAQPEPDREPAEPQRHQLGDRQVLISCLPGRHDPPADDNAAEPHSPVEELQPRQRSAHEAVSGEHVAGEYAIRLAGGCIDAPGAGPCPPDPGDKPSHSNDEDWSSCPRVRG